MRTFFKLFGHWLQFSYHCFDRVMLNGYLFFLHREANVAWFFRQVLGTPPTKKALAARTQAYVAFVETYARKRGLTPEWAPRRVRKEDCGAARRAQRRGVYAILQSMEQGPSFRVLRSRRQPHNDQWAAVVALSPLLLLPL